jgi:hypothetical protein
VLGAAKSLILMDLLKESERELAPRMKRSEEGLCSRIVRVKEIRRISNAPMRDKGRKWRGKLGA